MNKVINVTPTEKDFEKVFGKGLTKLQILKRKSVAKRKYA